MRYQDAAIRSNAIKFAAMFGFLSRELFFEFLCPRMRTQKYQNWNSLIRSGLFRKSKSDDTVLFLSPRGFSLAGKRAVTSRFHLYFAHDALVAKTWFKFLSRGIVLRTWTESQLKESPWDALSILGGKNLEKIPDLVMDLNGEDRPVRIAIEVEATQKSKVRYDQMALSYTRMQSVDLVMFVCDNKAIEHQVVKAFSGAIFRKTGKLPVTVLVDDFVANDFQAQARIENHVFSIEDFLSRALGTSFKDAISKPDESRTVVRLRNSELGTAA